MIIRVNVGAAVLLGALLGCATSVRAPGGKGSQRDLGRTAISRMAGCYLVDYAYVETEALKPGYTRDDRVYDPNRTRTSLEWIVALDDGPDRIRLQHVLFLLDEAGRAIPDAMIRHQAEDWEYAPAWRWEYLGNARWRKVETPDRPDAWVRRITHLDDGLRYQCLAPWKASGPRSEWSCGDNFAPIPGRESRDMKRSDYQALVRDTRLVVFGTSWVEHQRNVKTVVEGDRRTPLAKEVGRNWYVRVPDAQCAEARGWTDAHLPFWRLLQSTWADVFARASEWRERSPGSGPPRWARMAEVEEKYFARVEKEPAVRAIARRQIDAVIESDRVSEQSP